MQRVYSVRSTAPTHDQLALQETVFHNANGYLGVRGTLEEGAPQGMDTMRGAYVNGFYEIVPMKQAEKLTHVREDKESMINVADVQGIRFRLAGEWFSQWTGTLVESERRLDMDRGITERRVTMALARGTRNSPLLSPHGKLCGAVAVPDRLRSHPAQLCGTRWRWRAPTWHW